MDVCINWCMDKGMDGWTQEAVDQLMHTWGEGSEEGKWMIIWSYSRHMEDKVYRPPPQHSSAPHN